MTKAKHNMKRTLAVFLAIVILFFIMSEPIQPQAQAAVGTAGIIALIVALLTSMGIVFATETQAQQLAEHVYWETTRAGTVNWEQMDGFGIKWHDVGEHLKDSFPLGTMVAQFAAAQFQVLGNIIKDIISPAITEDILSLSVVGLTGEKIIFEDGTYYNMYTSSSYRGNFAEKSVPVHNFETRGQVLNWEYRNFIDHEQVRFVVTTGQAGHWTTSGAMNTKEGRMLFFLDTDNTIWIAYGGFLNGWPAWNISRLNWIPRITAPNSMLQTDTPPWSRFHNWDNFMEEGYNPDIHKDLDLIEKIIKGEGNVDLLVQPITGTGAAGVLNPDGESMTWEDAVSRPGRWTELEEIENEWDYESIKEDWTRKHPGANVQKNADGSIVVTLPDGRTITFPRVGPILVNGIPLTQGNRYVVTHDGIITTPLTPIPGISEDDIVILVPVPGVEDEIVISPDGTTRTEKIPVSTKEVVDTDIVIIIDENNELVISTDGHIRIQPRTDTDTGNPPGTDTGNPSETDTGSQSGTDIGNPAPPSQSPGTVFAMFPFCIPWDVYNIIRALTVEPVEPRFEFDMLPFLDADTTLSLNFDHFGQIVQIVRWGFMIMFIIGLAAVTRRYIWTGGG